jgi:hypothetical protein
VGFSSFSPFGLLQQLLQGRSTPPSATNALGVLLSGVDRDFNENDYEMLLRLDEGIEQRKGASIETISSLPTHIVEVQFSFHRSNLS